MPRNMWLVWKEKTNEKEVETISTPRLHPTAVLTAIAKPQFRDRKIRKAAQGSAPFSESVKTH